MTEFQQNLENYADLALKVGVNLQKGQTLYVRTPTYAAPFVHALTKRAYELGSHNVHIEWNDEEATRLKFQYADEEAFKTYPQWKADPLIEAAKEDAAFLSITGGNPDLLKEANPEHVAMQQKAGGQANETFRSYIQSDKVSWSIVAVPSAEWAKKVYPNESDEQAVTKLWNDIFQATRMHEDDVVDAWQKHLAVLDEKREKLNNKKFHALHYKANGTDLTIELPDTHIWASGGSTSKAGVDFVANIPTEEVFTAAKKHGVNGTVTSTKPLNYGGTLITDFTLTFKDGKIVDYKAAQGEATLKGILEGDEGSKYIGEVALVPHRSPISDMDLIFYNTLFDENASNHLAIGSAYAFNIEGGKEMNKEELEASGINQSITHVDFMMGAADMDIDGIHADGTREAVFRNGEWAI
ncbi:peptidase M29 [Bacillaceae bacterium JMAK1]|nr:peptidase M29 [Bacillaceae bacterium JMAK1]